jgi:hypothetical protein
MCADFHTISGKQENYFNKLLNLHAADEFRESEIHVSKPLCPGISFNETETATEKSPGINLIAAELLQAGGRALHFETHKHILYSE